MKHGLQAIIEKDTKEKYLSCPILMIFTLSKAQPQETKEAAMDLDA